MCKVLVCKTFIFLTFVHLCNCVYFTAAQIILLQTVLNKFIWKGQSKLRPGIMYAPVKEGSLNMINVKNVVHTLHVKWMKHLCDDHGNSWSRIIWPKIQSVIPPQLIASLMGITEQMLKDLTPFYHSILR